jgi:methionyl-tRNA formyltransferase
MGTPQFAVPTLKALIASKHEIVAVYTQAPSITGRGQKTSPSIIQQVAIEAKLAVYHPSSLKDSLQQEIFRQHQADIAVVAAYGMILPQGILTAPKYGCINLHPSDLPRWRGAAPLARTIMAGDKKSAICIMKMDLGLDTGDILLRQEVAISSLHTTKTWHDEASMIGSKLMLETIDNITTLEPTKQSNHNIAYAKKITKQEALINWQQSAFEIDCLIRGLNPWPLAYFNYQNEQIKIHQAQIIEINHNAQAGMVLDEHLSIACGVNAIRPLLVQRPSRKVMPTSEMLKSFNIKRGSILTNAQI